MHCSVCGSSSFSSQKVLWEGLVSEWQLSAEEADYINAQQGTCCTECGSNLRSIALAKTMQIITNSTLPLQKLVETSPLASMSALEINEAGSLSPYLRQLATYTLAAYPAVDMHAMPYSSDSFDLVLHSDTLEHVAHPLRALSECLRVLRPGGALCFTVPIIVGRLTRNREGLPKSYHGDGQTNPEDFIVHTEFGADAWTYPLRAGFERVEVVCAEFPAAIALIARKAGHA